MMSPAAGSLRRRRRCAALKAAIELNGLAWVPLPPGAAVLSMNQTDGPDVDRHRAGAGEVVGVAGDAVEAGVAQRVGEGVGDAPVPSKPTAGV